MAIKLVSDFWNVIKNASDKATDILNQLQGGNTVVRRIEQGCYDIRDLRGLSTDTKPTTGLTVGYTYWEVDTDKFYYWNPSSSTWVVKS